MAVEWADSFDTELSTSAAVEGYYDTVTFASGLAPNANGRTGKALRIYSTGLEKDITQGDTFFVGMALSRSAAVSAASLFFELKDGSTTQMYLKLELDRTVGVYRGDNTKLGGSTTLIPNDNTVTYVYVEFGVVIHNSAGTWNLIVNGVSEASGSSADTQNSANAYANKARIYYNGSGGSGWSLVFDDYYVCSNSGSAPWNTYLSGINPNALPKIGVMAITGAGASTVWAPDSGSNYARVNETNVDNDTSYVAANTAGDLDLYALADTGLTTNPILAVIARDWVKLDAAGSRGHCIEWRSNGVNYDGATNTIINTASYRAVTEIKALDPNTSAQWTRAALDALQIGHKVVS